MVGLGESGDIGLSRCQAILGSLEIGLKSCNLGVEVGDLGLLGLSLGLGSLDLSLKGCLLVGESGDLSFKGSFGGLALLEGCVGFPERGLHLCQQIFGFLVGSNGVSTLGVSSSQ